MGYPRLHTSTTSYYIIKRYKRVFCITTTSYGVDASDRAEQVKDPGPNIGKTISFK